MPDKNTQKPSTKIEITRVRVGMAVAESTAIYAMVISLVLIFVV